MNPILRRLRQEDWYKFEAILGYIDIKASLNYIVSPYLNWPVCVPTNRTGWQANQAEFISCGILSDCKVALISVTVIWDKYSLWFNFTHNKLIYLVFTVLWFVCVCEEQSNRELNPGIGTELHFQSSIILRWSLVKSLNCSNWAWIWNPPASDSQSIGMTGLWQHS